MKDRKYFYIGAIILIIVGYIIYTSWHSSQNQPEVQQLASSTPTSIKPVAAKKATSAKLSYGDAVKEYPNRFQFVQCHGNPGVISIKKGTLIMLDNRDALSRVIKIGSQTFNLAAYDYAVYNSPTVDTFNVLCDGGGAATLNVEK